METYSFIIGSMIDPCLDGRSFVQFNCVICTKLKASRRKIQVCYHVLLLLV